MDDRIAVEMICENEILANWMCLSFFFFTMNFILSSASEFDLQSVCSDDRLPSNSTNRHTNASFTEGGYICGDNQLFVLSFSSMFYHKLVMIFDKKEEEEALGDPNLSALNECLLRMISLFGSPSIRLVSIRSQKSR
jgi:hypothetical protein